MWISKKEYKKLMDEKQSFEQTAQYRSILCRELAERNSILVAENMRLEKEVDQLKVKYADEVYKNFELASHLSKNQSQ